MPEIIKKLISRIVALLIAFGFVPSCTVARNSETISENIRNGLLNGELGPYLSTDIEDIEELLSLTETDADGDMFFRDLDYSVNTSGSWRPRFHVQRLYYIAECCVRESDPEEKENLAGIVRSLADYWIKKDYQSVNWWYNEIAMPLLLGQTAILAGGIFGGDRIGKITGLVGRGCLTVNPDTANLTGTNATDAAVATIYYGALTENSKALRKAVATLGSELNYCGTEGLQRDGTFFQHGKRLYIGEYGFSFVKNYAEVLYILDGTDYSFSEKQLGPLSYYILNGIKAVTFGDTVDPAVCGRGVSRSAPENAGSLVPYLRMLAGTGNMPDSEDILAFADSIENNTKTGIGLRYFSDAAFLVINNPDFYFSFRGGSRDMYYAETLNGENILSYNSSFPGTTTIMGKGGEYDGISPVMDYSLVPGSTAVSETDEQLKAHTDFNKRALPGTYLSAAGKSAAISAAKTEHEGIGMTVACFATDEMAVLLGAGMKNREGKPMTTAVNQCLYSGDAYSDGNTFVHSGVKYVFLDGGTAEMSVVSRTGSYYRNNLSESRDSVTKDVFTLSLPCGGSYAYCVSGVNTYARAQVIVNNEKVQAVVLPDGRTAAVFWSAGSFTYNGKTYASAVPAAKLY